MATGRVGPSGATAQSLPQQSSPLQGRATVEPSAISIAQQQQPLVGEPAAAARPAKKGGFFSRSKK